MSEDFPHDTLFKAAMSRPGLAASELRVVLGPELVARIDWSTLRLLESEPPDPVAGQPHLPDLLFVAKRMRVDEGELGERRPDDSARGSDRGDVLVYLLFEHQSTQSRRMPLRLLRYMVEAWTRWEKRTQGSRGQSTPLPPIIPVLLAHAPGGWRGPARLIDLCELTDGDAAVFGPFVPDFRHLVDDLARASHPELLQERELDPITRLVLWVLRDGREGAGIMERSEEFFALLEAVAERGEAVDLVHATFAYLRVVLPQSAAADPTTLARAATRTYPRGAQIAMNSLQKLYEQGRQEGRQEGLHLGAALTLRRVLEARFGELTPEQVARLETLDDAALDAAIQRLLTAADVDAVLG